MRNALKTKITKRNVDAAEVLPKEYIIWHDTFPGFGLRVFPTGKKSYIFQYRHNGRTRRIAIGLHGHWTPDRAYKKAIELQNQVNEGLDPSGERQAISKDITVSALCDLYLAEVGATKKASTQVTDRSRIERHIKPLLGKLKVSAVSSADIDLFLRNVTNGATAKTEKTGYRGLSRVTGGKGTATRTLGLLGAVFSYAVKRKLRNDNPVREVIKPKDGKRERFLTAEELVRFGEALNTEAPNLNRNVVPALKLLIATGCRKSEILTLQWDDIDIVNRYLHLRDGKTGARKVPLNSIALSVISEIPRVSKCKFVFPSADLTKPFTALQDGWEKVRVKAGFPDVKIHDLRHTFATSLASSGGSLLMIGQLLGHRDQRTTQIYAHLIDSSQHEASEIVASNLSAAFEKF